MTITIRHLASGYWHIRGVGPCNWAQPKVWPVQTEADLEAFAQASPQFIRAALALGAAQLEELCG